MYPTLSNCEGGSGGDNLKFDPSLSNCEGVRLLLNMLCYYIQNVQEA